MSESSDAEPSHRTSRSLRSQRASRMRRRHHNAAGSGLAACRGSETVHTGGHRSDVQSCAASTSQTTLSASRLSPSSTTSRPISLTTTPSENNPESSMPALVSSQIPGTMSRTGLSSVIVSASPDQGTGPSNSATAGLSADQQQLMEETIVAVKVPM
ncbi:hypothetical protein EGW08_010931, partial [Elysia chlorotica]